MVLNRYKQEVIFKEKIKMRVKAPSKTHWSVILHWPNQVSFTCLLAWESLHLMFSDHFCFRNLILPKFIKVFFSLVLNFDLVHLMGFPDGPMVKNMPANAGDSRDTGIVIPGSGGSPGEGNGNPLQYSCLWKHIFPYLGNRQGRLVAYSPWGCKESDRTEQLSTVHLINFFWVLTVALALCQTLKTQRWLKPISCAQGGFNPMAFKHARRYLWFRVAKSYIWGMVRKAS